MTKNLNYQAAAIRHFLPIVEKEDPTSTIAANYRDAVETLEWLSTRQVLLRQLNELKLLRPDLEHYVELDDV